MTVFSVLYANIALGELPILISDVLVTSEMRLPKNEDRYKRVYIPSVGGRFPYLTKNSSIAGCMQKTYILKNGNCFVFAGEVDAAHNFYHAMVETDKTDEALLVCKAHLEKLQFACFVFEPASQRIALCYTADCKQLQLENYGLVLVGGSGESTIRNLLLKHQDLPLFGNEDFIPLARALCLVSEALDFDHCVPSETLSKDFGAYYEITLFTGNSFLKLERVLFSFWRIIIQNGEPLWQPTRMFFHEYINDVLVVRRIELSYDGENTAIWQDCYGIGGVVANPSRELVRSTVSESVPQPDIEVVSVELEGAHFRFVSLEKPIIEFQIRGDRWTTQIDYDQLKKYSEQIAKTMEASAC